MAAWPRPSADIQIVQTGTAPAPQVAAAPAPQTAIATALPPATVATTSATSPVVGVYITGEVAAPGVYIINDGSRLANLILIAGGPTTQADITAVNLAALLRDEQHWHIPARDPAAAPLPAGLVASGNASPTGGTSPAGKLNLNTADVDQLKILPGIGEVRAQAIVSHREDNGAFTSVDALLDVSGIGVATLESLRDFIEVR